MKEAHRNMHRRAQRAESETARVRREAIGQRKRADYWKRVATRLATLLPEGLVEEVRWNASIDDGGRS